jgi:hypothetical protein
MCTDPPLGRSSQAVHQRGLAGAGRPHDRGELAGGEVDIDGVEGGHRGVPGAVDLGQAAGRDGGAGTKGRWRDGGHVYSLLKAVVYVFDARAARAMMIST